MRGESGFAVTDYPSLPVASIKELIAYDKANPGTLRYGTTGTGSVNHLASELFNQMAGTKIIHVPYKGAGPALTDLLDGQIQILFGNLPTMIPQIISKRLRGIAVTTAKRSDALPETPTVGETVAGYEATAWQGLLAPKALPEDVVARWNRDLNYILQLSEVKERMVASGIAIAGGSPERFREFLKREVVKWRMVIKIADIKPGP